jgi:hypothetical protein
VRGGSAPWPLIDWFDLYEQADAREHDPLPVSYQQFKRAFIARVPRSARQFEIAGTAISAWLHHELAEHRR